MRGRPPARPAGRLKRGDRIRITTAGHSARDAEGVVEEVLRSVVRVRLEDGRSIHHRPAA
jgi:sRNA-binding protein